MADAQSQTVTDTRWMDGMRGIASVGVVVSHLVRFIAEQWISPTNDEGKPPSVWQQPPFRLHSQGAFWLGIFCTMTGFVNALKPIQKSRAGEHEAVFLSLSRRAFKRTGRLVLPTTIATVCSWVICQFGGYELARRSESEWMASMVPARSATWADAVHHLYAAILATWKDGGNSYDKIHSALTWLLNGSFWIYLTLLATTRATLRGRTVVVSFLFLFSWVTGNVLIGLPVYAGILLAELAHVNPANYSRLRVTPYFIVAFGLFLGCYPERRAETAVWSYQLRRLGEQIFPWGTELQRALPTVGGILVIVGVLLCQPMQKVLSISVLTWLGEISFALYLIHGTLLKSTLFTLIWLFGYEEKAIASIHHTHVEVDKENEVEIVQYPPDMKIALPTRMELLCILPLWWITTLCVCQLWVLFVEPRCSELLDWIEKKIFPSQSGETEKRAILPLFRTPAPSPERKEKE